MTLSKRAIPAKARRVSMCVQTILLKDGTIGPTDITVTYDFADAQNEFIPESTSSANLLPHVPANFKAQQETAIATVRSKIDGEVLAP